MAGPSFKRHSKNACLDPLTKRTASYHLPNNGMNPLFTIKLSWQLLQLDDLGCLLYCKLWTLESWRVYCLISQSQQLLHWFVAVRRSHRQPCCPKVIRITLKQLKTNQYRKCTHIYLGRTSHQVCPVKALIFYLDRCEGRPGPLFILPTNQLLTRVTFSEALSTIFQKLNMYPHNFNTHSFRIGAATSAKQAGISNSHLKALGRWRSNTYLKYVHMSPQTSYPSIWLQHPTHAASLLHSPTITVLSFSPHRLYIHCYRPVCMCDLFIVVL